MKDLSQSFKRFFAGEAGFPKFHKKFASTDSFRFPQNFKINEGCKQILLPGIGYQDAGSFQASLKAKAASDPVLRSAVASVGAKNTSEVGASDWTALVKAARGAVRE